MKKVNNKKGFTLAELLVVVAILAILIAIAVPIFGGALNSAEQTARDSNTRTIKSAAMVSIMTNNIAKGTWGWSATATVTDDGDLGAVTVTAADSAVTNVQPTSGVAGSYTVGLQPTDLTP